jgi:conjugal transfer pilus assembly protein TraI
LLLLPAEAILDANKDLIGRIKLCYGCDTATFTADLLRPIRRYIVYVNQLPATADAYFSGQGGLARIGLETGFYALQATDSQIFAGRTTISNRRVLEPRWRRATFIAGLCHELHRALSHVRISGARGLEWQPYLIPLSHWALQHGISRSQIRWIEGPETPALGLFAMPMIVPPETLCDLATGNSTIVPHMMASIAGATMYHEHNVMYRLVRHAAALVIHRNLRSVHVHRSGRGGVYLARYFVEAMRELVLSNHAWQPNVGRSRVWYGQDGLFLLWPNAVNDLIKLLQDERLPGIPDNPSAVLDILAEARLAVAQSAECRIWTIYPPDAAEPIEAIKLSPPTSILAVLTPQPTPLPRRLTYPATEGADHAPDAPSSPTEDPAPMKPGPGEQEAKWATTGRGAGVPEGLQLSLPEMDQEADGENGCNIAVDGPATSVAAHWRERASATKDGAAAAPHEKVQQGDIGFSAPMRLNPAVARVLAEIVRTLAGPPPAACQIDVDVLFVPLGELARRGVDARQAQRALGDAGMLARQPDGERIHTWEVSGAKVPGLLLNAQCVTGLRTDGALADRAEGRHDAPA